MRRPGPALIAVRAVDAFKVYLPFMLLQGGFASRLPELWQGPWAVFVWLYSLSRIHVLFFDWLTRAHRIDADGITVRAGWPLRVETHAAWPEVASVSLEQDAVHRLLRRHRVRIELGAEDRPTLVIEALTSDEADALRAARAGAAPVRPRLGPTAPPAAPRLEPPTEPPTEPDAGVRLTTSWRDLALIAVTHGQVALVVPFAVSAYYELSEWVGLPSEVAVLGALGSLGLWLVPFALAVGFGYGLVRAWLRFGGHGVRLTPEGYELSRRAVDTATRLVRVGDVVGVRIDQNPLMRALGLGSLHLVLRRGAGDAGGVTVLPVARMSVVEQQVRRLVPGEPPAVPPLPRRVVWAVAFGAVPVAVSGGLVVAGHPWLAGLLALVVLLTLERVLGRFGIDDPSLVTYVRGWWVRRRYVLASDAVRAVSAWDVRGRPVLCALTVLDQGPVELVGVGVRLGDRARLRDLVRA